MPKINQEEYEVLKALDDKWEWIARDKDGTLVMGAGKNERYLDGWFPPENIGDSLVADEINAVKVISEWGNLFQFIKWEDEEPYNISELIEEYERYEIENIHVERKHPMFNCNRFNGFYNANIAIWDRLEESEEKEVEKDKQWLRNRYEQMETVKMTTKNSRGSKSVSYIKKKTAINLLNQLDEPEVLSSDWISKNVEYAYFDMLDGSGRLSSATAIIKPEKLQNLLVPKQEVSMIPNYVAKWISRHHEQFDLYPALKRLENNMSSWENVYEWYRENTRNFVNAYLTGEYEIEQEPKYYAKIKGHENIGSNDKYWNYNTDMEELSIGDSEVHPNVISEYILKATKDEWANLGITEDNADFVKVEEMEE